MFYWSLEILLISRSLSPSTHARPPSSLLLSSHGKSPTLTISSDSLLVLLGSPRRRLLLSFPSLPSFPRNDTVRFWNISFSVGTCFAFPLCLSVSLWRGPHRGMTCMRFVRTGWPESLENMGWQDRSSISTRSNARGQCKTSLLETLGGKTKTWIIAVQSSRYALGLWQWPSLNLPEHPVWCTSNALAKKGKAKRLYPSHYALKAILNCQTSCWFSLISGDRETILIQMKPSSSPGRLVSPLAVIL